MDFKDKLYTLRKEKNYSQENLAEKINVTRQTISNWELGISTPELQKIIELAEVFNITTDELLGIKEESNHNNQCSFHYEYKSKKMIGNLPLIHINIGYFGVYRAKGVIAFGNIATGIIALGALSFGVISLGGLAVGLLSFGGLAIGLLLAFGGIALAPIALGGMAIGLISYGGFAVGLDATGGYTISRNLNFKSNLYDIMRIILNVLKIL